jgi:hypothetical protein
VDVTKPRNWDEQPLGQMPDYVLAEKLGVNESTVFVQRKRRGIPAASRVGTHEKVDWSAQPLGQMSDAELARALGVGCDTVQRQRNKRGIPRFRGDARDSVSPERILVLRVESHDVLSGEVKVVGNMTIANVSSADAYVGDYDVNLIKHEAPLSKILEKPSRAARISGYNRKNPSHWLLIAAALKALRIADLFKEPPSE